MTISCPPDRPNTAIVFDILGGVELEYRRQWMYLVFDGDTAESVRWKMRSNGNRDTEGAGPGNLKLWSHLTSESGDEVCAPTVGYLADKIRTRVKVGATPTKFQRIVGGSKRVDSA
ncbi:hypothetical protein L210DRAFT_3633513 [Boletus edulis BED1]|uniref:Uncharacterized protein n=1 Tax=Boletus edulis BED1 TaxID=1328754 RepID=A0AAD4BII4_BOLED|nr:hypothetical protein L210DRAFT_3633513 [Boletus edulis BED1]